MIVSTNINTQKNNSKPVSNINKISLLTNVAYVVYDKLLITQMIQEQILESSDFLVLISLITCGDLWLVSRIKSFVFKKRIINFIILFSQYFQPYVYLNFYLIICFI